MRRFSARINLTKEPERDDIVYFKRTDNPDLIVVTYHPGESRSTSYTFYATLSKVEDYIWNLLRSLDLDTDPFQKIQVTPKTGPAIIYEISDLSDSRTRNLIHSTIMYALETNVENESSN